MCPGSARAWPARGSRNVVPGRAQPSQTFPRGSGNRVAPAPLRASMFTCGCAAHQRDAHRPERHCNPAPSRCITSNEGARRAPLQVAGGRGDPVSPAPARGPVPPTPSRGRERGETRFAPTSLRGTMLTLNLHAAAPHTKGMKIRLFLGGRRPPNPSRERSIFIIIRPCGSAARRRNENKVILGRAPPSQTLPRVGAWGNPVSPCPCGAGAWGNPVCPHLTPRRGLMFTLGV